MKKLQKSTLRIFLSCMVITAVLMLVFVWMPQLEHSAGSENGPAPIMQFVFTFFIIGLASFLVWFTTTILEIKDKLTSNR